MEWYLVIDGVRRGPMSKASVLALIDKGVVKSATLARRPDMNEWFPIGYIREFNLPPPDEPETPSTTAITAPTPPASPTPPPAPAPTPRPPVSPAPAAPASPQEFSPPPPQPPATTRPFLGRGYLGRHWRGEYSLPVSYWLNWTLLGLAAGQLAAWVAGSLLDRSLVSDDPRGPFAGVILAGLAMLLLTIWQMTGVWRAALRARRESGRHLWPNLTLAVVLLTAATYTVMLCMTLPALPPLVALFFQGDRAPHRVELTTDGKALRVSGWLGLGIAGEVRDALRQHPDVQTVELDSRDGRASAGVALGRALAEGGVTTLVRGVCDSPCSTAFTGGARRLLAHGGRLGFHQPSAARGGLEGVTAASAAFMAGRGVRADFIDAAFHRDHAEPWTPPPRALFEAGVIHGVLIGEQVVDATAYPAAAVQALLDDAAALPSFQAFRTLDAAAFDASQARLRAVLSADGSGDPDSPLYRHALRRELHDAALRYLPVTSDAAALGYLKADLDRLRVLRSSDPEVCRALIYPQFSQAADPSAALTEETQKTYDEALNAVLADALAGERRAPRDAQSAADRQQVLAAVLGRFPPVFAAGLSHPEEFRALEPLPVCAFHVALREELLTLPPPRSGAALRRMAPEILGH